VGTTTPSVQKFVVAQTSALDGISAVGNHSSWSGIFLSRNYNATGVGGASGVTQLFTAGSNGAASGWLNSAGVLEAQTQNGLILGAYATGDIHFQTGVRSTRMTINNAGNLGIGTTSPYAKLSVVGQAVAEYFTATSTTAINTLPLLTSTTATTTNLAISGVTSSLLKTNALGQVTAAVAGTDYATPSAVTAAYPFALVGNATSTLTQFNGGITAFASSTVGNGNQNGGITISGGATTTGNAYFATKIGIGTQPSTRALEILGTAKVSSTFTLGGVISCTGNNALQTNGSGDISCGAISVSGVSAAVVN
jgi:hypothetical protein